MESHFYNPFQELNKAVILPTFFSFCCLVTMISASTNSQQPIKKRKRTENRLHKRNLHLTTNNSPLELLPKEILDSILHKLFDSFVQTFLWSGIFCEGFIHAHVYSCIHSLVNETTSGFSYTSREVIENIPYWYTEEKYKIVTNKYNVDPKFVKQNTKSAYGGFITQICNSCKCEGFRHYHGQCKSCDHIKLLTNCLHDLKGNCKCNKCLFSTNIAHGLYYKKPDFYCRCGKMTRDQEEWHDKYY